MNACAFAPIIDQPQRRGFAGFPEPIGPIPVSEVSDFPPAYFPPYARADGLRYWEGVEVRESEW
jgi:hypothetical protein